MTILEPLIRPSFDGMPAQQHPNGWIERHTMMLVLAGCALFWVCVAVAVFAAMH